MKTTAKLTDKMLKRLIETMDSPLATDVIQDIIDTSKEDRINYIDDVIHHGCSSGIATGLIYYSDTQKFFDKHSDEIFELLEDYKDSYGEEFSNYKSGNRKNDLAWFAYETIMDKIANELELEF